jgi:hypothetical protein
MTSKVTRTRAALLGLGLALAVSAASSAASAQGQAAPSKGPSADELKAARETFQEAYKDEQEKRYTQALEKFQRVAAVKESASVRYRIGSVLESLGRLREARDAFRALAASKPSLPASEHEIADSAAERAHILDKKIPRVVLRLQPDSPLDTRVSIDGAPVPAAVTPRNVELDPGEHVVQASSPTSRPSETRVTLPEGGQVEVVVVLVPLKSALKAASSSSPQTSPSPSTSQDSGPHRDDTLAYVALGGGGALLVTGLVLLGIRAGDIAELKRECGSDGVCPIGKQAALQSTHDEAQLFGPLGLGLGLVGLAAAGTGAYLLLRPAPASATPANGTTTSRPSGGVRVSPMPLSGGAMLRLGAAF